MNEKAIKSLLLAFYYDSNYHYCIDYVIKCFGTENPFYKIFGKSSVSIKNYSISKSKFTTYTDTFRQITGPKTKNQGENEMRNEKSEKKRGTKRTISLKKTKNQKETWAKRIIFVYKIEKRV